MTSEQKTEYTGTFLELEDQVRKIILYRGYAEDSRTRKAEAVKTEDKNIEFETARANEAESRIRELVKELGLVDETPTKPQLKGGDKVTYSGVDGTWKVIKSNDLSQFASIQRQGPLSLRLITGVPVEELRLAEDQ